MLKLGPYTSLLTHTRFKVLLRNSNDSEKDLSLILFRLSPSNSSVPSSTTARKELYLMQGTCPHMGADISLGDIEDFRDGGSGEGEEEDGLGVVVVCPWHRYDFDVRTGISQLSRLRACVYRVDLRDEQGEEIVYIEAPTDSPGWTIVETKAVSEAFADVSGPSPNKDQESSSPLVEDEKEVQFTVVPEPEPQTMIEWAVVILNTGDPWLKVSRTRHASDLYQSGQLTEIGDKPQIGSPEYKPPTPPLVPPRTEKAYIKKPTPPSLSGKKSRLSALHALANIEQWAIDLAWDIIVRYVSSSEGDMPEAFYSDFIKVARDEAKHFSLLAKRIEQLSDGEVKYGDGTFPVNAGLWESALETKDSLLSRLAIIHMVHEARGLDVNPQTIERFRRMKDGESVDVLEVIHSDEITHVTAGHRWFTYLCSKFSPPLDPVKRFREEVRLHWKGDIKGPFNEQDRATAGLSKEFYDDLKGEREDVKDVKELREGLVQIRVEV
ncbi:DUF455-domain-containing protein [Flagelloscypha sp. PMI_526]|nr:DUF455-domain-containing protein [Flagelloscypha sp. PMI_526]